MTASYRLWGEGLEPSAVQQLVNGCSLPVAAAGALMPDAHVGYGLPIGGVLATRGAVIPYAVGVDIACRMKLSVLDLPAAELEHDAGRKRLSTAIERETRFGIGVEHKKRKRHGVLDRDWAVSPITKANREKATPSWAPPARAITSSSSAPSPSPTARPAPATSTSRRARTWPCSHTQVRAAPGPPSATTTPRGP